MDVKYTTEWADMPQEVSFDEMLNWRGMANAVDNGFAFQMLFVNGVFYTGRVGQKPVVMRKCSAAAMLDKVFL